VTTPNRTLAARTVTGVLTGMVIATAAATIVGFWLSYDGLHDFALHAGLRGPEAWAWPASVDLFIVAGEAGVTISALRRRSDWMAWGYLALGFAASVTANVLHVATIPAWGKYAVAAVPPVAAMLALAALLRHVYAIVEARTEPATGPIPSSVIAAAKASMIATIQTGNPWSVNQLAEQFSLTRSQATKVRQEALANTNGHGPS
jgi:uncharacterized PurR-regulated membrane protein YhhQ (DUF165 family)